MMNNTVVMLAAFTFISTVIGGFLALKFKRLLPYLFAFASGSLIAVVFFDLLPESLEIANSLSFSVRNLLLILVASFLFYSFIERFFLTHHHHEDEKDHGHILGPIGAGSLIVHSLLDGVAIGIAYQANTTIGLIVGLAVVCHDFTDGVNTVTLMLKHKQNEKKARNFLILDAIAPLLGIVITSLFTISEKVLVFLLPIFAGEFLYIGAANLLPETHKHSSWKMAVAMTSAVILIFVLTGLVGF